MRSRTFYSEFNKTSFIKQLWNMGILLLGYLLLLTVPLAIMLNNWRADYELKAQQMEFTNYMIQSDAGYVLLVLASVFLAFTQLSYYHSRQQMDFYGSFPVRRERLFTQRCVFAYLDFVIPYTLVMALNLLIGASRQLVSGRLIVYMLENWVVSQIGFLLIFFTAAIAILLTGRIWVGLMGSVVLLGFGYYVQILLNSAASWFFDTYMEADMTALNYGSPIYLLSHMRVGIFALIDEENYLTGTFVWNLILTLLVAALLFVICLCLVKIRRTEKAGMSMAFGIASRIIHMLLSVFGGVGIGMVIMSFVSYPDILWFFMGTILGTAFLYVLIQFIYTLDIRKTFSYKWQILAVEAAAILFCSIYGFDLFGYDTYLPKQEKIESVAVYYEQGNGYGGYIADDRYISYQEDALKKIKLDPDDMTYEMLTDIVAENERYWSSDTVYNGDMTYQSVSVSYHMKNGKSVERRYRAPLIRYKEQFETYYDQEMYRRWHIPSLRLEDEWTDQVVYEQIELYYAGNQEGLYDPDRDQDCLTDMKAFIHTYNQEVKKLDGSVFVEEVPVAVLGVSLEINGCYNNFELPVYESCTETLAYMKKLGYDPLAFAVSDLVTKIEVEVYGDAQDISEKEQADLSDGNMLIYTEPEEIAQILPYVKDSRYENPWIEYESDYYVTILAERVGDYSISFSGYFLQGQVPEILTR